MHGVRQREYTTKNLLPLSGRNIPEFNQRRSIKDMFKRKHASSNTDRNPTSNDAENGEVTSTPAASTASSQTRPVQRQEKPQANYDLLTFPSNDNSKRTRKETVPVPPPKRSKSGGKLDAGTSGKGQQSLMGFFKPQKAQDKPEMKRPQDSSDTETKDSMDSDCLQSSNLIATSPSKVESTVQEDIEQDVSTVASADEILIDPIVSKESWTKLFTKKTTPKCEEHQEPCIMLTTKKPGVNCGRSFWMCSRPLGPSGQKEKGTQWRCKTFIWASDWNGQD